MEVLHVRASEFITFICFAFPLILGSAAPACDFPVFSGGDVGQFELEKMRAVTLALPGKSMEPEGNELSTGGGHRDEQAANRRAKL
jgi:hypothetical protein